MNAHGGKVISSFENMYEVDNKGTRNKEFSVSWGNRFGTTSGPVHVALPSSLTVKAGKTANLKVNLSFDAASLPNNLSFFEADGYVVLKESSQAGEVLRIPYHAVVQKVSKIESSMENNTLQLHNDGAMASSTDLFRFDGADRRDKAIPSEYDLRATGSRVFPSKDIVEFAVATDKPWATPNTIEFDVAIDNNFDGRPDWIIFNYDLYAFFGLDPNGKQISVGYNIATGQMEALYFVNVGGSWNNSVMGIPAPLSMVAPDGKFQYQVASYGYDSDLSDTNDRGWVTVDASQPDVSFATPTVKVAPQSTSDVPVTVTKESSGLLIISDTDHAAHQYSIQELNR